MALRFFFIAIVVMTLSSSFANASDPDPLQDFCVAIDDPNNALFVNGKLCKNPNDVNADDFLFRGLNKPGNTSNLLGSKVTLVNIDSLAGLNTLGVSIVRVDFAPHGVNPPHAHPRASEILVVLEGTLYVGFVLSNPTQQTKNKLFAKTLYSGDVFVFPRGLIHFQLNVGKSNAIAFASFNSQNPGVVTIANTVFGSDPPINPDVLTKAFELDDKVIEYLQSRSWFINGD